MGTTAAADPWGEFAYHEATLRNLISFLDSTLKKTGNTLKIVQKYLDFLAGLIFDDQALDCLLESQGGVCVVINKTCCTCINVTGEVEVNPKELYKQAPLLPRFNQGKQESNEDVERWFPGYTWLLPFLGSVMTVILILLYDPCIFNCLARYLFSRIQLQLQMMSCQGFQTTPSEEGDHQHLLDNVAASSTPHSPPPPL